MYPHFEEVRDGGEPWLMARWKVRKDFLFAAVELFFASAYCCGATRQTCQHYGCDFWKCYVFIRRRNIDSVGFEVGVIKE